MYVYHKINIKYYYYFFLNAICVMFFVPEKAENDDVYTHICLGNLEIRCVCLVSTTRNTYYTVNPRLRPIWLCDFNANTTKLWYWIDFLEKF
jgi:hypothetical protein